MVHALKCEERFYDMTIKNEKNYEIRFNDRNFAVGDTIVLSEWNSEKKEYTGRSRICRIKSIVSADDFPQGLKEGYVILGIGFTATTDELQAAMSAAKKAIAAVAENIGVATQKISNTFHNVDWNKAVVEYINNQLNNN